MTTNASILPGEPLRRARPTAAISGLIPVAIELSEAQVERIAERAAALLAARMPSSRDQSPLLTITEAAQLLRCRRQRIDDLLSQGRLTRLKDGSRTLIAREEIEAHLRRRRIQPRKTGSGKSSGIR